MSSTKRKTTVWCTSNSKLWFVH